MENKLSLHGFFWDTIFISLTEGNSGPVIPKN